MSLLRSLKGQLWFATLLILVLVLGALVWQIESTVVPDLEGQVVEQTMQELDAVVVLLQRQGPDSLEAADMLLREMGKALDVRITYIAEGGEVLVDSSMPLAAAQRLENHADRPEIRQAAVTGRGTAIRFSDTLAQEMIYVAQALPASEVLPKGVVRFATPYRVVRQAVAQLYAQVAVLFAVAALVAISGMAVVIYHIRKSIAAICRGVAAVGGAGSMPQLDEGIVEELVPLVQALRGMALRVETQLATVVKQGRELEAVLNGMRAGVVVLDGHGRIVRGNPAARDLFPDLSAFVGRQIMELTLEPALQQGCEEALARRQRGETGQLKVEAVMAGRTFDISLVPVHGDEDIGVILLFHDITVIRRTEQVRRDFVANVSHELRTPLTSIKGYAETLLGLDGCATEPARGFLETILRNANQMHALIEDVLQLSRLEHGRFQLALAPTALSGVVGAAWKGLPLQEGIEFQSLLDEAPLVQAHWESLVQVFRNVLENALKYVPRPGGVIAVHAEKNGRVVRVHVDDNGPGIPPEEVERVFERFYRVEKDRSRAVSGTGLGLAICRHLMNLMGGSITATSPVPGAMAGARFTIILPLAHM